MVLTRMESPDIVIKHRFPSLHGFFSCCTIRIKALYDFLRVQKRLPATFDYSDQFFNYKEDKTEDLEELFFVNQDLCNVEISLPEDTAEFHDWLSNFNYFEHYDTIKLLFPFVQKFFKTSDVVEKTLRDFEEQHRIDYSKTIAVCYRGNDKSQEISISPYSFFIEKAREVLANNPGFKFLIQTDEIEFRDAFVQAFPNNSFYNEKIPAIYHNPKLVVHHTLQDKDRSSFAVRFLGMVKAMSKCKIVITNTGNVGLWIVLYRGNLNAVHQIIDNKWFNK